MSGLVLTRELGREIIITAPNGDKIVVGLHAIEGRYRAKIRVEAPDEYKVDRKERCTAKQRERARAAR